jgi:hypothetical protein
VGHDIGRWEVYGEQIPLLVTGLTAGSLVEVEGHTDLMPTQIEVAHSSHGAGEYVSVDGLAAGQSESDLRALFAVPKRSLRKRRLRCQ